MCGSGGKGLEVRGGGWKEVGNRGWKEVGFGVGRKWRMRVREGVKLCGDVRVG